MLYFIEIYRRGEWLGTPTSYRSRAEAEAEGIARDQRIIRMGKRPGPWRIGTMVEGPSIGKPIYISFKKKSRRT